MTVASGLRYAPWLSDLSAKAKLHRNTGDKGKEANE